MLIPAQHRLPAPAATVRERSALHPDSRVSPACSGRNQSVFRLCPLTVGHHGADCQNPPARCTSSAAPEMPPASSSASWLLFFPSAFKRIQQVACAEFAVPSSAETLPRRPHMVCRQFQHLRHPFQLLLSSTPSAAGISFTQPFPLHQRILPILHFQFRQRRSFSSFHTPHTIFPTPSSTAPNDQSSHTMWCSVSPKICSLSSVRTNTPRNKGA